MAKTANGPRIVAFDANGKATRIKAERLEIHLGNGRSLQLSFPELPWGDLDVEAVFDDDGAVPVLSVRAGACNLLTLRADLCHHLLPAEPLAEPAKAGPPVFRVRVTKALDGKDKAQAPKKHLIRRWAQAAVRGDVEVGVRLVGEDEGRALNRQYRGKDQATNVLSFSYGEEAGEATPALAPAAVLEGDIVLCVPLIVSEAEQQGKAMDAHFAHLVVHGMLHLQGYDHESEAAAEEMESLEREILSTLGYADPYA